MRLLIGVPTLDYVNVEFMNCLMRLIMKLKDEHVQFDLEINSGTLVYLARERIAHKAINEKYTHVLWLDSDMVFNDSILDDLMFCGQEFVTGIYHARRKGYASVIFKDIEINNITRFEEYPNEPFQIAGCGFGCCLTSVPLLSAVCLHYGTCFTPLPSLGEDIAFCKRAKDLGYKLWCEPTVICGHIGHITIYPEDHEAWKKTISNYDEVRQ